MHLLANKLPTSPPTLPAQPDMLSGTFAPPPNEPWAFHYFEEKEGFSLSPPNIWKETDWWGKKMLEAYRRAHADFFEVWKRVIGFDRQWDCCDCRRNIYSATTQHASKTITVYYSYQTLLYNSLAGEGLLTCGNCVDHQRPHRECVFFVVFFVVKWKKKLSQSVDFFFLVIIILHTCLVYYITIKQ